jgi:asparagine synthetase B (glutamine-hydrolysing)
VRRQFANHYLDLTTFQQVRHWPKEDTDLTTRDDPADISEIMDKITARLSTVFCEILRKKTCIVPLSGGRDSRCLVACGMPEIHRASTLFAWRFHRMSKWDTEIGSEIAESLD